jgi:hypothetical protein
LKIVVIAMVVLVALVACDEIKEPKGNIVDGLPQDGPPTPGQIDSNDDTRLEITDIIDDSTVRISDWYAAAEKSGLRSDLLDPLRFPKSGMVLYINDVVPHEQEIGKVFGTEVGIQNFTHLYLPENSHNFSVYVETTIFGPIKRVDDQDPDGLLSGQFKTVSVDSRVAQKVEFTCTKKGIASFSVSVETLSAADGDIKVTGDVTVDCVVPPTPLRTPTPTPEPLSGITFAVNTLVIDGNHYLSDQFDNSGASAPDCDQFAFGAFSIPYESSADGKLMFVPGIVLSFEDPQSPSLQPLGVCGYGLISEHYPYIPFEVDLKTFEAFCDRYRATSFLAIPDELLLDQFNKENQTLRGCRQVLQKYRR